MEIVFHCFLYSSGCQTPVKFVPSPSRNLRASIDVSRTLEHAYLFYGISSVILGIFLRNLMVWLVSFDCIDLSGLICTMCKVTVKNLRFVDGTESEFCNVHCIRMVNYN